MSERWKYIVPPKRRIAIYVAILVALVLIKVIWVWWFLVPAGDLIAGSARDDLLTRRRYVISCMYERNVGLKDQPEFIGDLFKGEWALGGYSMATYALTNLAFLYPETREETLPIVSALIERLEQPEIRNFDKNQWWGRDPLETLDGPDGHAGFLGHLNMMLCAHQYLGGGAKHEARLHEISSALARRVIASPFFHIETYPKQIYNMDNAVVAASLVLYDRLYPDRATGAGQKWLEWSKAHLRDPETGLFCFELDEEGKPIQLSRGSGAGWNSFFLYYVDPAFAIEQFANIRKHFVKTLPLGIMGIREFYPGRLGHGDVDSGPVIFELSTSGTGFALAGARYTKDEELTAGILYTSEVAGFSLQWAGKRFYLLAPLVGESIMLAMKTVCEWDLRFRGDRGDPGQ